MTDIPAITILAKWTAVFVVTVTHVPTGYTTSGEVMDPDGPWHFKTQWQCVRSARAAHPRVLEHLRRKHMPGPEWRATLSTVCMEDK